MLLYIRIKHLLKVRLYVLIEADAAVETVCLF